MRRFGKDTTSRRLASFVIAWIVTSTLTGGFVIRGQQEEPRRGSDTSHPRERLSPEAREIIDLASAAVCKERISDPKASVPIDDMQSRPSLPVGSPEAIAGAKRAQRLLPIARSLAISSLQRLAKTYSLNSTRVQKLRLKRATARIAAVRIIRPDMDSRDNASVFMQDPHTIIFGTIFLAGLPSDEGIISVLAHELVHIGDGGEDSLKFVFRAVGERGSELTGLKVQGQRAEELTCDLVGTLAAQAYVSNTPSYESLARRLSRSLAHNCVVQDDGDDDHLSPRSTIRALLTLNPSLSRELVYGRYAN